MPHGTPSYTVPKSGCRLRVAPQDAMRLAEFGSTGADDTSRFHALSGGNTLRAGTGTFTGNESFGGSSGLSDESPVLHPRPTDASTRSGDTMRSTFIQRTPACLLFADCSFLSEGFMPVHRSFTRAHFLFVRYVALSAVTRNNMPSGRPWSSST